MNKPFASGCWKSVIASTSFLRFSSNKNLWLRRWLKQIKNHVYLMASDYWFFTHLRQPKNNGLNIENIYSSIIHFKLLGNGCCMKVLSPKDCPVLWYSDIPRSKVQILIFLETPSTFHAKLGGRHCNWSSWMFINNNTLFWPFWPHMFRWNDEIVLKTSGIQGPYVWETQPYIHIH